MRLDESHMKPADEESKKQADIAAVRKRRRYGIAKITGT